MILQIVAVRDRAADVYGQPTFVPSIGIAIRSFSDEINRTDGSLFAKHPEDFDLFHLGSYEDASGKFSLLEDPRQIAIGKDCVRK